MNQAQKFEDEFSRDMDRYCQPEEFDKLREKHQGEPSGIETFTGYREYIDFDDGSSCSVERDGNEIISAGVSREEIPHQPGYEGEDDQLTGDDDHEEYEP